MAERREQKLQPVGEQCRLVDRLAVGVERRECERWRRRTRDERALRRHAAAARAGRRRGELLRRLVDVVARLGLGLG